MARKESKLVEAVDKLILETLALHNNNITKSAAHLNCSVRTIANHVRKFRSHGMNIYNRKKIVKSEIKRRIASGNYCKKCGKIKHDSITYANGACSKCVEIFQSGTAKRPDASCVKCGKFANSNIMINHISYCVACRLDRHNTKTSLG